MQSPTGLAKKLVSKPELSRCLWFFSMMTRALPCKDKHQASCSLFRVQEVTAVFLLYCCTGVLYPSLLVSQLSKHATWNVWRLNVGMADMSCMCLLWYLVTGSGTLAQWLKLSAQNRGFKPCSGLQSPKKQRFIPRSLENIQHWGEPPWQKGSVIGLNQPGMEFRIMCLEGSVISPFSCSHGPV